MNKKNLALLCAMLLVVVSVFAGCSKKEEPATATAEPTVTTEATESEASN